GRPVPITLARTGGGRFTVPGRCAAGQERRMRVQLTPSGTVESHLVAAPVSRQSAQILTRFTAREHGTAFWVALWLAAAAAEFGALVPVIFDTAGPVAGWQVVFRLVGGSFAVAGLIAWRRRPDSHIGVLMTVTGFLFFLSP